MNIPYLLFEKITNKFSEDSIIGRGGFGDVYKGVLDNKELIAVKLLHAVQALDARPFNNEVATLFRVDHPNIVGLLGYCDEIHSKYVEHNGEKVWGKHICRVLCFQYFPSGSLQMNLYEQSFARHWNTRYNIIKGICEGLNYLHGCEPPIFHLDLKPANILLDSSMVPKLADFGLSRLFSESHTHVTQQKIGTDKYMPPEYRNGGKISEKNDVFSLGVVMIDIMEGPEGYSLFYEMGATEFKEQVLAKWSSMIEPTTKYRPQLLLQVKTCINLAMRCVDSERRNRPTIATILATLDETEAQLPSKQLAVQDLSLTSNLRNSLAETLRMMKSELDSIKISATNMEQVPEIREAPSNVEEPFIIEEIGDRETSSYVEEGLIIGRTEERKKILSILSESSTKEMVILPIYGIGGIGKTTLAQLVYSDTQFSGYSKVWVYVSEQLDLYKIGNSIISQLTKGHSNIADMQILHNHLGELFADKRILIVLDDLWEDKPRELDKLKAMLRLGKGRRVIIVTTRDEAIARKLCSTVNNVPYKLENLTDAMCWAVIKQKSEFENHAEKNLLEQIGREIAVKCAGVALAAQSLGYMLRYMTSDQWESVRDSDIWNLSTSEDPSVTTHEVLASLRLSYSHMHKFLRRCFSYCAVFSKGHIIAKYDLIHQWIALGFPQPSEIFDSMQLCEQYVTQLLGMSFLQYSNISLGEPPQDNDAKYFTMHDLVHDLARAMLADKVNKSGSIAGISCQYALITDPSKPLQSFLSCPKNIKALHYVSAIDLSDGAISAAECLVVLDLEGCFIRKLPDSIGQLKQLRYLSANYVRDQRIPTFLSELSKLNYLSLRHSRMKELPDSIGDMEGLMYLDLSGCERLSELPVSFAHLKQLVHLDLTYCPVHISESWGSFTKLQHLNLSQSIHLNQKSKNDFNVLAEVIRKLTKLQYLNLSFSIRSDHTKVLPGLEVFRKLTKLRYLSLAGCMSMVSEADIQGLLAGISFHYNLEHLNLSHNEQLNSIPESIGNLRKLHTLDLSRCNIQKLPAWMAKMASLKIVNMKTLHECGSNLNLILLVPRPVKLKISKLEDVKSLEEARRVKLIDKWELGNLTLEWTVGCQKRFVDDKDVLEKLVPPNTVRTLNITGYMSLSFPTNWLMGIGQYLPNVFEITLQDLPNCNNLTPLGQLPYLENLSLYRLGSLEEWNTADSCGELTFPKLETLDITSCPKLRMKPCLPRALRHLFIKASDNILTSCCESVSIAPSYSVLTSLVVKGSKLPLYEWRFLQHVSALSVLFVKDCIDLSSCSPEAIQHLSSLRSLELEDDILTELPTWLVELTSLQRLTISVPKLEKLNDIIRQLNTGLQSLIFSGCGNIVSLPQWLGELISLKVLRFTGCKGLRSLPGSIRQLTELHTIQIESNAMCYNGIRKIFSSISADTDEVDIHQHIAVESKRYAARRKEIRRLVRNQPSGDTSSESRIKKTAATDVGDLAHAATALSIESGSTTKNLLDPPADSVRRTQGNIVHKRQGGVRHTRTRRPRQHIPAASSSGSSNAHALIPTDEVDAKSFVNSFSTISVDSSFIFSATKKLSDPPANATNPWTHDNVAHKQDVGVRHTSTHDIKRPWQLLSAASPASTNSPDTSSGSRINNSAADALIPTDVVATAAATDMEDLLRSFSALSLEAGSATEIA